MQQWCGWDTRTYAEECIRIITEIIRVSMTEVPYKNTLEKLKLTIIQG